MGVVVVEGIERFGGEVISMACVYNGITETYS